MYQYRLCINDWGDDTCRAWKYDFQPGATESGRLSTNLSSTQSFWAHVLRLPTCAYQGLIVVGLGPTKCSPGAGHGRAVISGLTYPN